MTAQTAGDAANDITIDFVETDQVADGEVLAVYDAENTAATVYVSDTAATAMADIASALQGLAPFVTAVYTQNGAGDTDFTPVVKTSPSNSFPAVRTLSPV